MADDDKQSNIGVEDAIDQSSLAQFGSSSPSRVLSLPGSFELRGQRISIDQILIAGQRVEPREYIPIKSGQNISFMGTGLSRYSEVNFLNSQSGGRVDFVRKNSESTDSFLRFSIPDLDKQLAKDSFIWLELVSPRSPEYSRILAPYASYRLTQKAEQEQNKTLGGESADNQKPSDGQIQAGLEKQKADFLTGAGGQVMAGSVGGFAQGLRGKTPARQVSSEDQTVKTASSPAPVTGNKSISQTLSQEDLDAGAEAEITQEVQTQTQILPENIKQSAGLVGEYIDKNPGVMANVQTRQKVLSALKNGNLGSLSAEEHRSLQTALQTVSSVSGGGSAQVQSAAKMVAEASSQIKATINQQAGDRRTSVSVEAETLGGGNISAEAKAQEPLKASLRGQTASFGSQISLKDSISIVGEYLDKNPGNIPDASARGRILQALANGNIEQLSPEDKQLLITVLNQASIGPEQSEQTKSAIQAVLKAAQGKAQPREPLNSQSEASQEPMGEAPKQPSKSSVADQEAPAGPKKPMPETDQKESPQGLATPKSQEYERQMAVMRGRQRGLDAQLGRPLDSAGSLEPKPLGQIQDKDAKSQEEPAPQGPTVPTLPQRGQDQGSVSTSPNQPLAGSQTPQTVSPPRDLPSGGQPLSQGGDLRPPFSPSGGPAAPVGPALQSRAEEAAEKNPAENTAEGTRPEGPSPASRGRQAQTRPPKSALLKEAEDLINKELDIALNGLALSAWVSVFGIVIGAIAGDLLLLFGPSVIRGLQSRVFGKILGSNPLFKSLQLDKIQLKISAKVKLHILGMNLVCAAAVFLFVVLILSVVWGVCNNRLTYFARETYGLESYCGALDKSFLGKGLTSITTGSGQFQASYNVPGSLISTASWTESINGSAQRYNIDACILRVIVQKESGGLPSVIGCDCRANGRPGLCLEPATTRFFYTGYKFNWTSCSYGIGLTQWTIYPFGGSGYQAWRDPQTPSRNILGQWYTVNDLLDPQTSLGLTAQSFSQNLARANGDVAAAFAAFVGQSSRTGQLVNDRMALYNLCVAQR